LDAAVAAAYGWNDLVEIWEEAERGAFYDFATKSYAQLEADEKDLGEARKNLNRAVDEEILKRLLALNLERAAAEAQAAQQPSTKKRTSRAKSEEELI